MMGNILLPFSVDDLLSLLKSDDIEIYSQAAQIHSELRKVIQEGGEELLHNNNIIIIKL